MLRPYQQEIISITRSLIKKGFKKILIEAPTGSGKTTLASFILSGASKRNKICFFNVHRRELINQSVKTFRKNHINSGIVCAGFAPDYKKNIQICSILSLARRIKNMCAPDIVVWDECHHITSASWKNLFNLFPNAIHIGLTATPIRLDGKGLDDFFDCIVSGPKIKDLIADGFLSPFKYYAPFNPDLKGIRKKMGDFQKQSLSTLMSASPIIGDCVKEYKSKCDGKSALIFAVNIEHSKLIAHRFNEAGISAKHIDGDTPSNERDKAVSDFESGKITILTNCDLFGEGFNVERIESIILMRPTMSFGLFRQQIGRGLRTFKGKQFCTILDLAGNCFRHGLPDDEIEWSLKGFTRNSQNDSGIKKIKTCKRCFAAIYIHLDKCPYCGFEIEPEPRAITELDGELAEVSSENLALMRKAKKKENGQAKTLEDLIELGKKRGYKNPVGWANHMAEWRKKKGIWKS